MTVRADAIKAGDSRSELVFDNLSRTQLVMYAGASGDYNPLHTDDLFTREVAGYPGVFAHGMLSMGATGRVLTDWFGADRLTRYGVRFVNQVWPGDTLTATATVEAVRHQDGQHFARLAILQGLNQGAEAVRAFRNGRTRFSFTSSSAAPCSPEARTAAMAAACAPLSGLHVPVKLPRAGALAVANRRGQSAGRVPARRHRFQPHLPRPEPSRCARERRQQYAPHDVR